MSNHASVYEVVTVSIIEELKHDLVPWVRPWTTTGSALPHNAVSQRAYTGINVLLLWSTAAERGYPSPAWLTYKQAIELGGIVNRGEKSTAIVYASTVNKKERDASGEEIEKHISFLKFYHVFNVAQTSGLPDNMYTLASRKPLDARLWHADAFLKRVGAPVRHGGDKAYYSPAGDFVVLPRFEDFISPAHYYATSLHEHVHYSGHPTRLNRDLNGRFGTRSYAAEELVAELGAAFLCAFLDINAELRHASYIASWLELLQHDSRAIFTAAGQATKAANYLRSFSS
jgi:antirestriction protein ArdC